MILDVSGNPIDPLWLAEFRGFFYGEGYLGICSWGKLPSGRTHLSARAQITLRSDDAILLSDFCHLLGGCVYEEKSGRTTTSSKGKKYESNPYTVWRVTKASEMRRLCDILAVGLLPAKKKQEVATIRQFLDTVHAPGKRVSPEEYTLRETLWNRIKALHQYSDS